MLQFTEICIQGRARLGEGPGKQLVSFVETGRDLDGRRKRAAARLVEHVRLYGLDGTPQAEAREHAVGTEDRIAIGFMQRRFHRQRAVPVDGRSAAEIGEALEHENTLSHVGKRGGGRKPPEARPDDDRIPVCRFAHGRRSRPFLENAWSRDKSSASPNARCDPASR